MKLYCSECYNEIDGGSVLLVQVLSIEGGDTAVLSPKVPMQKFCLSCAAELSVELQARFNGKVDEKILELIQDFNNFLQDDNHNGIENVIGYFRDGVNIYFGYDDAERDFSEGELIQFRLLTTEEAQEIPEEVCILLENISNHVFVTIKGAAFTVQDANVHLRQN